MPSTLAVLHEAARHKLRSDDIPASLTVLIPCINAAQACLRRSYVNQCRSFDATILTQFPGDLPTRRLPRKLSRCCKHSVRVLLSERPNSLAEASECIALMSERDLVHSRRFAGAGEMGSRECNQGLHCIAMSSSECYKPDVRFQKSPSCPNLQSNM